MIIFLLKEGLNINISVSLLYHIKQQRVHDVVANIGVRNYEEIILASILRSAVANITSRFLPKTYAPKNAPA